VDNLASELPSRTVPMVVFSAGNEKLGEKKQPGRVFVENEVTDTTWKSYARKGNSSVHQGCPFSGGLKNFSKKLCGEIRKVF